MYSKLAHLYDWPGHSEFTQAVLAKDLALFEKWQVPPSAYVLELASGTGDLAIALAETGYLVTALEISEPMLARAKAKPGAETVRWGVGDMTAFALDASSDSPGMDIVLCHDDSLNHLLIESDLKKAFACAYEALKPGGRFVFDLNTLENYQTFWRGTDTYDGPNYRLISTSEFDELTGRAQVTYLAQEHAENGLVETAETVIEQFYSNDTIHDILVDTGFMATGHEPFNPLPEAPPDIPLKTLWYALKPAT